MLRVLLVFILILALAPEAGAENHALQVGSRGALVSSRAVVEGRALEKHEYPEMVNLRGYDAKGQLAHPCSAVNINGCLISVEHCLTPTVRLNPEADKEKGKAEEVEVAIAKTVARDAFGNEIDITKAEKRSPPIAKDSDRQPGDDLVIVKTGTGLAGAAGTGLLASTNPKADEVLRVAGFGDNKTKLPTSEKDAFTQKRVGRFKFISDGPAFAKSHPLDFNVKDDGEPAKTLITDHNPNDTEFGDSGGPVFRVDPGTNRRELVGLHIGAVGEKQEYLNHVSIADNRRWIDETLRAMGCTDDSGRSFFHGVMEKRR